MKVVLDHIASSKKPLIVIVGPTASGKSNLAIELATQYSGEIINADSRQFYTHMQIGTGKVTSEEMQGIPHHLLDTFAPNQEVTVGWFQKEATTVIEDIFMRGNVPILVGGSMLYISSIIDGLELGSKKDSALRKILDMQYDEDGGTSLYSRLLDLDPDAASTIHPHNKPRVVRTLEMVLADEKPKRTTVPYDVLLLGLGANREEIVVKINNRVEAMFTAGWIDEVHDLLDAGYTKEDFGMKACGYKEIMEYLESSSTDLQDLKNRIAAKTRQYARRQMTWWKKDERITWI